MKRSLIYLFLTVLVLLPSLAFANPYSPHDFRLWNIDTDGYRIPNLPGGFSLFSGNNYYGWDFLATPGRTIYSTYYEGAGTVEFDWSAEISSSGWVSDEIEIWWKDNHELNHILLSSGDNVSGTLFFHVNRGDGLIFEITKRDWWGGRAELTVSNYVYKPEVPEPSSLLVLTCGLVGAVLIRRRLITDRICGRRRRIRREECELSPFHHHLEPST